MSRKITRETKLRLFNKAGGRCSLCGDKLTFQGERAHISPYSAKGPRSDNKTVFYPLYETGRNDYENLILVCATDHRSIDAQSSIWTVPRLCRLKSIHETYVSIREKTPATATTCTRYHFEKLVYAIRDPAKLTLDNLLDIYLAITDNGLKEHEFELAACGLISLTALLFPITYPTGKSTAIACGNRVLGMCELRLLQNDSVTYELAARWNLIRAELHQVGDSLTNRPNLVPVLGHIRKNGEIQYSHLKNPIPLRYPTVVAAASQDILGPDVPAITPVRKLLFSPRFLGLISFHNTEYSQAEQYFNEADKHLADAPDTPALRAAAHLMRGERKPAAKLLDRLARMRVHSTEPRHRASWEANVIILEDWVAQKNKTDICLEALSRRAFAGTSLDMWLEHSNLLITPIYEPVRRKLGSFDKLINEIDLVSEKLRSFDK